MSYQTKMGKAQVSTKVRSIPVSGAVYPACGPKQPVHYGPKVSSTTAGGGGTAGYWYAFAKVRARNRRVIKGKF